MPSCPSILQRDRRFTPKSKMSSQSAFPAVRPAEPAIAMALKIPAGSPILLIERTSYTPDHHPVDCETLHYRGDYIRFQTRLASRRAQHINRGMRGLAKAVGRIR
jgi:hypothetical protein